MGSFTAYLVSKDPQGRIAGQLVQRDMAELGSQGALVRVQFSSLNYKDALALRGDTSIVKTFPHVPGIDAAGFIVGGEKAQDPVLVTGFGLGTLVWGGYGDYVRVPPDWILPLPSGLSLKESMVLGTAGLTAALAIEALLGQGARPGATPVLVTGATGGVGSIAVMVLSQLGFSVTAWTRRPFEREYLLALGAAEVLNPAVESQGSEKALHKARWGAVVDTVGGAVLAQALKGVSYGGTVAACGMAAGTSFQSSVFPFILRGIKLFGIDSVLCPREARERLWGRLAGPWKPRKLTLLYKTLTRCELDGAAAELLAGRHRGRSVVVIDEAA